jgi:hypothetical protein
LECPTCGLINPDDAKRCDCGYDFELQNVKRPYLFKNDHDWEKDKRKKISDNLDDGLDDWLAIRKIIKNAPVGERQFNDNELILIIVFYLIPPLFLVSLLLEYQLYAQEETYWKETGKRYQPSIGAGWALIQIFYYIENLE